MSRILIADDQTDVLEALRILLKGEGHQTDAVTSLAGVFQALEKRDYAILIMDLNYTRDTTSGQEGLEILPRLQAVDNTLPIVVMTAWATIDLAVEAMKRGARDFIPKPWDNERLLAPRGRESIAARQCAEDHRRIAAHATGPGIDLTRRPLGRECADHGREWHRQRSGRAGPARALKSRLA